MPGERSTAGGPVEAICPHCEKHHKIRIALEVGTDKGNRIACEWTGRGVPRVYCIPCKKRLGMIDGQNFPRLEYDTIEGRI